MAKYTGASFSLFLVDGYNLIASLYDSVTIARELITEQTNPFGASSEEHTPIGLSRGEFSVGNGIFDATADALHTGATSGVNGVSRIVCAAIQGNTPGKMFIGAAGAYSQKYDVLDSRDGLTKANVTYLVTGNVDEGQIIQDHATFTADWDTKTGGAGAADTPVDFTAYTGNRSIAIVSSSVANPSVITTAKNHGLTTGDVVLIAGHSGSTPTINGSRVATVTGLTTFTIPLNVTVGGTGGTFVKASTNSGGVGYLEVTAFSGFSGAIMKIMHSPDDVTYAAKVTFANVTSAPAKERAVVTGTVDRYLSSNGDVTGTGSITVFSGFSRTI